MAVMTLPSDSGSIDKIATTGDRRGGTGAESRRFWLRARLYPAQTAAMGRECRRRSGEVAGKERFGIAVESTNGAQRHVADDPRHPEGGIVGQPRRQCLVGGNIGAGEMG